MYFTYVLKSIQSGRLIVGLSKNIEVRFIDHNKGRTKSTKAYRPWEIVYFEEFNTLSEARAREIYFKSGLAKNSSKHFFSLTLPNNLKKLYICASFRRKELVR